MRHALQLSSPLRGRPLDLSVHLEQLSRGQSAGVLAADQRQQPGGLVRHLLRAVIAIPRMMNELHRLKRVEPVEEPLSTRRFARAIL